MRQDIDSNGIRTIYKGKVAKRYDFSLPPFFIKWKKKAFERSSIKRGDRVVVFCCGTGLDFPHILKKIGKEGEIIGVDFSSEMLKLANDKIAKNGWVNIKLIEADITDFENKLDIKADVGVCTLGLSIISDYKSAYINLLSNVKKQGEIIIGDMQLASGWLSYFDPITIYMAKKYGGSHKGHQNSLNLYEMMKKDLTEVVKEEFFFKAYYYCIGKLK